MGFYSKSFDDIKSCRPSIKDETVKDYLRNIRKISRELFKSERPSICYFIDYESIIEYMNEMANPFSRKTMCTSILVLLSSCKDFSKDIKLKYKKYHKGLASLHNTIYNENVKSTKEETNWVTREETLQLIGKIKEKIDGGKLTPRQKVDTYQQYLVLNLYTQLPPVRNDYVDVKIVDNNSFDEEKIDIAYNYINFSNNTLYMCNYKTAKFYGVQKINIPETLMVIIKEYEKIKKEIFNYTGPFMLINTTNKTQMNTNTLTKYINKIFFPKKVSTTILRKVYLSEKYPITHSMSEMQADAVCMGHNVAIARQIYTKKLT